MERAQILHRQKRGTERDGDLAGGFVAWNDLGQRFDVSCEARRAFRDLLRLGQLGLHIAREVIIGRDQHTVRGLEHQRAQFSDDGGAILAVNLGHVTQIKQPSVIEARDQGIAGTRHRHVV